MTRPGSVHESRANGTYHRLSHSEAHPSKAAPTLPAKGQADGRPAAGPHNGAPAGMWRVEAEA